MSTMIGWWIDAGTKPNKALKEAVDYYFEHYGKSPTVCSCNTELVSKLSHSGIAVQESNNIQSDRYFLIGVS